MVNIHDGFPKPREMRPIVKGIKKELDSRPFALYTIDWSGSRMGDILLKAFERYGGDFDYVRGRIKASDDYKPGSNKERKMMPVAKIGAKYRTHVVIFDDETRSGLTVASGIMWALDNIPEAECIYTAVYKDRKGVANFCSDPRYDDFEGPHRLIEMVSPRKYARYLKDGSLSKVCNDFLSEMPDKSWFKNPFKWRKQQMRKEQKPIYLELLERRLML